MLDPGIVDQDVEPAEAFDRVGHERRAGVRFAREVIAEDAHQRGDFGPGALPVVAGEGKERQRSDAQVRGDCNNPPNRLRSFAVPGDARQPAKPRPPAVAVHDDGNVQAQGERGRSVRFAQDRPVRFAQSLP